MTIWTLIKWAPTIIALWGRMGRTPFNDFTLWGGIIAEVAAIIARLSGVDVPVITDVAATGLGAGALAHKHTVAKEAGFDQEWKRRALQPKD